MVSNCELNSNEQKNSIALTRTVEYEPKPILAPILNPKRSKTSELWPILVCVSSSLRASNQELINFKNPNKLSQLNLHILISSHKSND